MGIVNVPVSADDRPLVSEIRGVWRGGRPASEDLGGLQSGYSELDKELPGAGWPTNAVVELHCDTPGVGELRLLMPALGRLTSTGQAVMLFTSPSLARLPVVPHAPALTSQNVDLSRLYVARPDSEAQLLWALEQTARAGSGSGVGACVAWVNKASFPELRRLQLAAETGGISLFLFRPENQVDQSSPAPLRLQLWAQDPGLAARIVKRRGAWLDNPVLIPLAPPGALRMPAVPRETEPALDRSVLAPSIARPDRTTAAAA